MVWEVIYSENPREALEKIEGRRFDDEFYSLSEEAVSEFDSIL